MAADETSNPDSEVVTFRSEGRVVIATINRPEALNALNAEVLHRLVEGLATRDLDPGVGCFVLTGSGRAFAAGADIKELQQQNYQSMFASNFFADWDRFAALRTPKIAAVSGYALGGGCEVAMMCDVILAADTARFGQPEITLGLTPGMGGTQRLTRLVGRAKAMEMILTGRMINAEEAERIGLVSRVIASDDLQTEALATAQKIASYSKHTAMVACELVDAAERMALDDGVRFERRSYYALFDTADAQEGMAAFVEKRDPAFNLSNE